MLGTEPLEHSRYKLFPLESIVNFIGTDTKMRMRLDECLENNKYFRRFQCNYCRRHFLTSAVKLEYVICPFCEGFANRLGPREARIGPCVIKETESGEPTRCEECLNCAIHSPKDYDRCLTYCAVRNWKGWKLIERSAK